MVKQLVIARDIDESVELKLKNVVIGIDFKDDAFKKIQDAQVVMRDFPGNLVWFPGMKHPLRENGEAPGLYGCYVDERLGQENPFGWITGGDDLGESECDKLFGISLPDVPESVYRLDFILTDETHNAEDPKVKWIGSMTRSKEKWFYVSTRTWTIPERFSMFISRMVGL